MPPPQLRQGGGRRIGAPPGLEVGAIDAQVEDLRALRRGTHRGVGVDADEQVGVVVVGDSRALILIEGAVVVAGHDHRSPSLLSMSALTLRLSASVDRLLEAAARTLGAVGLAAVARIEHHRPHTDRRPRVSKRRRRRARRRRWRAGAPAWRAWPVRQEQESPRRRPGAAAPGVGNGRLSAPDEQQIDHQARRTGVDRLGRPRHRSRNAARSPAPTPPASRPAESPAGSPAAAPWARRCRARRRRRSRPVVRRRPRRWRRWPA